MGWKTLKEKYQIRHNVQVEENMVCIGSGYIHNLLMINHATGEIKKNSTFNNFGEREYPALMSAAPSEIIDALAVDDVFQRSIPVYTYEGSQILKKYCEEVGYPNTTHDGCMMYENTFSTDRDEVVRWAIRNAEAGISLTQSSIERLENDLASSKAMLLQCETELATLQKEKSQ